MSVTDPIADALTKIRNAYRAEHMHVMVNHNNIVESIVRILAEENFINSYELIERNVEKKIYRKQIFVNLRYTNTGSSVMLGLERVSKPGRRVYIRGDKVPSVLNNIGCAIISTSSGVMVDRKARKEGGFLCCLFSCLPCVSW